MTEEQWENVAASLAFGGSLTMTLIQAGLELRAGKCFDDVRNAAVKAFNTPPFKTERHLEKFAHALKKILQAAS